MSVDTFQEMLFFNEIDAAERFADCAQLDGSGRKDLCVSIDVVGNLIFGVGLDSFEQFLEMLFESKVIVSVHL